MYTHTIFRLGLYLKEIGILMEIMQVNWFRNAVRKNESKWRDKITFY